ncbi:uncharacterized protein LOC133784501 [Humulus lupulus]|uniref:uncharacterized protein LOC133784501 n=1 Tax=Humulus lupulus TaxID=3486 RepID=UPI002B405753|nr:uncharacterized protein LOC133784501 [Humulus lupulus]
MKMEKNSANKSQNMHSLTKLTDAQSLKIVLISVSLFSFFFSHSSLLSFLHSLNFYISTFPYQLFTHNIDKNCIFLICNGLLVFLAKYSGLIRTLSLSNNPQDDQSDLLSMSPTKELLVLENKDEAEVIESSTIESSHDDENVVIKEEEETVLEEDRKEHEQESEYAVLNQKEEEKEEEEETSLVHVHQEEEEEEEHTWSEDEEEDVGNGKLSTEELNKKFDEFIRRMKAELKIEAQQQLIMV